MPTVKLPPMFPGQNNVEWTESKSIVIIGANGSGKSRMGAWIEQHSGSNAHRIGAQRALTIPQNITPQALEVAEAHWRFGMYEPSYSPERHQAQRLTRRWHNDETGSLLNDYQALLALLFADEVKSSLKYSRAAVKELPQELAPKSNIVVLTEIWNSLLPHRTLNFGDHKVEASNKGVVYAGGKMSDGERVILYLIGQVLCAPTDTVIVIDEPEIHVHEAIQGTLWDHLESARPDCAFVYITHDLRFAATRTTARKIWVRSFDGVSWEWEDIPADTCIPEKLLFELLGNRRPVLFVEGEKSSLDGALYTVLYRDYLVIPCQSGSKVEEATKAMVNLEQLHHMKPRGFVDRDRKDAEEIRSLQKSGITVIGVAEVENLYCIPEAVKAVATLLKKEDGDAILEQAKGAVFRQLAKDLDHQSLNRAVAKIQFQLNGFGPQAKEKDSEVVEEELKQYLSEIDLRHEVEEARQQLKKVLNDGDYHGVLRLYNSKELAGIVAKTVDQKRSEYCRLVVEIVKDDPTGELATAMRLLIEGSS